MKRHYLPAAIVRRYIARAGGTNAVAERLGVPAAEVIRWARKGLVDNRLGAALTLIGFQPPERHGPPPRCELLFAGELEQFVALQGGLQATAHWLGVSLRALRRYRSSEIALPPRLADRVTVALKVNLRRRNRTPGLSPEQLVALVATFGSYRKAAQHLGLSKTSLIRYCTGETPVPFAVSQRLASYCNTKRP